MEIWSRFAGRPACSTLGLVDRPADANLLAARHLVVRRAGRTILDVAELSIRCGEILAIIGPNGAGKSTLLKVLALLQRPEQGEIVFDGVKVSPRADLVSYRRRIAMVFQEPLLFDTTVFKNVASGLELRGVARREIKRRVAEWLERFGVAGLAKRAAHTLSGGEAQRVSLARAFVLQPDLLLLDEPFASLDQPTRFSLLADLEALLRETGTTTVFVTHDRTEALTIGDRIGVMIDGRILDLGEPERVFAAPASAEVASFVGVENILPGQVAASGDGLVLIDVAGQAMHAVASPPKGQAVLVCLRPEDITLTLPTDSPSPSSARNLFPAVITRLTPFGAQWRASLDCGFPIMTIVTKRSAQEMGLQPGSRVVASFKASAVHLIQRENGEK